MAKQYAVIFDVDGVLVDSSRAHFLSWQRLGEETGLVMTEEQFVETFGRTSREIIAELWGDRLFTEEQIREIDARKEALYREILAEDFPAMEGAADLIKALRCADFALAVGSSGPPENVTLVLEKLEVEDLFDVVITGMDVTKGKPDPQVFLLAAERMRMEPSRCAVIEDSPAGIAAANAAGMVSIALQSGPHVAEAGQQAALCVSTLRALSPERIAALITRRSDANEGD
ncbi:MAG: HAD family phosphatase [Planctomycetes bacterium]|nr:HAD family phosphatase [Planctomycetota bacterium]